MKIMIVDDDEIALKLLESTLMGANYNDVTTMSSAQDALDYLDQSQELFDCFMLDIMMPGIDGITLCKILRDTEQYARIPIMMISALTDQGHIDRSFMVGATDYIAKPFNEFELHARVRAANALSKVVKAEEAARMRTAFLTQKINNLDAVDLAERFEITSVPQACDLFELDNSPLNELDANHAVRVLAFKIKHVSDIHAQLTSNEFRGMINIIGGCIANAIDNSKMQIAYAGNGTYVCTEYGSGMHDPDAIEASVIEAVGKFQLTGQTGNPMTLNVMMGQPENTNFWSSMEAAAGIHNALQSLELIDEQEQEIPPLLMARAIREMESNQQDRKNKAYH